MHEDGKHNLISAFDHVDTGDELDAALLVNQAIDASINAVSVREQVVALADSCTGEPWEYLSRTGFAGNRGDYASPSNSCIADVLKRKTGIPISLGVLLIAVARLSGRPAHGINFPGHFLVRVGNTLIDPFDMVPTSENERLAAIEGDQPPDDVFEPVGSAAIAIRMLNNVKYQFAQNRQWRRVLEMLECQCAITPTEAVFHFERGEVWRQLGRLEVAQDAYLSALINASDAGVIKACRRRLAELDPGSGVVH
ncbi:MAG: transglutaminase-like domain-containing protein [Proteobacteria bacterium]|nr:transglutaminase-like domain-containing protein [Pseudomonadota bacterium]